MWLLVKWFGASSAARTRRPKRLRYLGPAAGAVNAPLEYPRAPVTKIVSISPDLPGYELVTR